jgi:hypothetical protein
VLSLISITVYAANSYRLFTPSLPSVPDWVWLCVFVGSVFVCGYLAALGERANWWTAKRGIFVVVIAIAATFFVYAFVGVSVPNDENSYIGAFKIPARDSLGYTTYALNDGLHKPLFFDAGFNFTAPGSLSVNNPITVHVQIWNVNNTAFSTDYLAAVFTGCFPLQDDWAVEGSLNSCLIPLHFVGVTNHGALYAGTGTEKWLDSGPSYLWLRPTNASFLPNNLNLLGQYEQPVVTIQPVADTLSAAFDLNTLRLTYILIGLSILTLIPVLDAVVTPDKHPAPA